MSVTANIHEAKTTLSKLIQRALDGEEVVIAKAGKPLVHLVPIADGSNAGFAEPQAGAWLGAMAGQVWMSDDFDRSDEEVEAMFDEALTKP